MQHVYSPADSAEAHMLVHLLEQSNITAFVQGDLLSGAVGGIPANDLLRISVADEDAEKARALILAWEKQQPVRQEQPATAARSPLSLATMCVATCALAVGWFANEYWPAPKQVPENHPQEIDQNQDGKTDLMYYYPSSQSKFPSTMKADNNFNGVFEYITEFDAKGIPYTGKWDGNEDGTYETITHYYNGLPSQSDGDTNNDGKPDIVSQYLPSQSNSPSATKADDNFNGVFEYITEFDAKGVPYTGKWDKDEDGKYETIVRYTNGVWSQSDTDTNNDGVADLFHDEIKRVWSVHDLKTGKVKIIEYYSPLYLLISADFDSDDDGIMDTRYRYDRFNQITSTEKITKP
jgi:Putative prokaryotic signal transducing protein